MGYQPSRFAGRRRVLWLGGLLFLLATAPAHAERAEPPSYYMVIFSCDGMPHRFLDAHTFAAFVKVHGAAVNGTELAAEVQHISWVPQGKKLSFYTTGIGMLIAKPGENWTVERTLEWARSKNLRVCCWGPYRITEELYQKARAQRERLEGECLTWKALDRAERSSGRGLNCMHAVADVRNDEPALLGATCGERATRLVVRHLRSCIIEPQSCHDFVLGLFGASHPGLLRRACPD